MRPVIRIIIMAGVLLLVSACGYDVKRELSLIDSDQKEVDVLVRVVKARSFEYCVFFDEDFKMIKDWPGIDILKTRVRYVEFWFRDDRCYGYKMRNSANIERVIAATREGR